jgi:hypothetical protein
VVVGPEDPPGSGSAPLLYAWGSITTQQIYTADTSAPFSVMKPFEFVAPAVENTTNSTDFPPAAFSADSYQQLSNWQERKCKCRPADGPFTGPVCCDTDYFLYQTVTPPPSTCEMHPITSSGELWLDPPIITADANDNAHLAVTTPWPGKSNIGGCPCQ